jgi:hypothetical protein
MNRVRFAFGALVALAACDQSQTGVEVVMRLGTLQYDELRLGVTHANDTLVDPQTDGRFLAPFRPGDQSVIIYLSDALDGETVRCDAEARSGGAVAATGSTDAPVVRHKIDRVEIAMGGTGGAGGAPTGTGTGGAGATSPTGTGGTSPPARGNGEACSIGAECLSTHCSDGVCCEEECHMACRSCALPDTMGLCRPVPDGTPDPRGMCNDKGAMSCQTNGLCDVAGDCAVYPAGTVCAEANCADMDTAAVPARTCDGAGRCQEDGKKMKCPAPAKCAAGVCS